jgi:Zn-dependent protease with chaperone function
MGVMDRFITLPDGAQLQCPDAPWLEQLPQEGKTETVVAWLERRTHVAVACIVLIIAGAFTAYKYGVPKAADLAARAVPIEYEVDFGRDVLERFDEHELFFRPTELEPTETDAILRHFETITKGLSLAPHYTLHFRSAPMLGPNAFALPGGTIVVTDELVALCDSYDDVVGVLAHEIGHAEHRHTIRQLLRSAGVGTLATGLTGDVTGIATSAAGLPVMLVELEYSREFERAADDFGFELLAKHGMSPLNLANALERISAASCRHEEESEYSFLSTHPTTKERIERAKATAEEDK